MGTLHNDKGWQAVRSKLPPVDAVEVRVDSLPQPPSPEEIQAIPCPAIVTVRDVAEGGSRNLPIAVREALYLELLPVAMAVDLEAVNLRHFSSVIASARSQKISVIASFHDFQGTPSPGALIRIAKRAVAEGATCVKFATTPKSPADLAGMLTLFEKIDVPIALMGMGPLGKLSRLLFSRCGSCLNYAWLGSPQVPGQWSVTQFHKAFASLD